MKNLFLLFGILLSEFVFCQVNSEMKLKEFFDEKKENATGYYEAWVVPNLETYFSDTTGADDLAEVIAPVMDAQLVLYETTKDKGYLINFINDAIQMVSMRADYLNIKTT